MVLSVTVSDVYINKRQMIIPVPIHPYPYPFHPHPVHFTHSLKKFRNHHPIKTKIKLEIANVMNNQ